MNKTLETTQLHGEDLDWMGNLTPEQQGDGNENCQPGYKIRKGIRDNLRANVQRTVGKTELMGWRFRVLAIQIKRFLAREGD